MYTIFRGELWYYCVNNVCDTLPLFVLCLTHVYYLLRGTLVLCVDDVCDTLPLFVLCLTHVIYLSRGTLVLLCE